MGAALGCYLGSAFPEALFSLQCDDCTMVQMKSFDYCLNDACGVFCNERVGNRFVIHFSRAVAKVGARVMGLYDVMVVGSLLDLGIRVMYECYKCLGRHAVLMIELKKFCLPALMSFSRLCK